MSFVYRIAAETGESRRKPFDGLPECQSILQRDHWAYPWQLNGREWFVTAPIWLAPPDQKTLEGLPWIWAGEIEGRDCEVAQVGPIDPEQSLRDHQHLGDWGTSVSIDGLLWRVPRLLMPTGDYGQDVPSVYGWGPSGMMKHLKPSWKDLCGRGIRLWKALAAVHQLPGGYIPAGGIPEGEIALLAADLICLAHDTNVYELTAGSVLDDVSAMAVCYEALGIGAAVDALQKKKTEEQPTTTDNEQPGSPVHFVSPVSPITGP